MRGGRWVVAEEDGQVLGYVYCGPFRALVAAVGSSHRQRAQ